MLYGDRSISIAPLYDAICTAELTVVEELEPWGQTVAAPMSVDTIMGMRLGSTFEIRQVSRDDTSLLARQCGLTPRYLLRRVGLLSERVLDQIGEVVDLTIGRWPEIERTVADTASLIRSQTERVASGLAR